MNMLFIKKIGITFLGVLCFLVLNCGCYAYGLRTGAPENQPFVPDSTPVIDDKTLENINEGGSTFSNKLEGILHFPQKDEYTTSLGYVTSLIQVIINWLLGILAFIALVYMIYCGFLVFSSGSDDKNASKGKKGISTAAIALAGVGLAWLVISAMIRFINMISAGE